MEFIQKYAAIDGDGIYSKVCCNWLVMDLFKSMLQLMVRKMIQMIKCQRQVEMR